MRQAIKARMFYMMDKRRPVSTILRPIGNGGTMVVITPPAGHSRRPRAAKDVRNAIQQFIAPMFDKQRK
jgi:hypothetical protein